MRWIPQAQRPPNTMGSAQYTGTGGRTRVPEANSAFASTAFVPNGQRNDAFGNASVGRRTVRPSCGPVTISSSSLPSHAGIGRLQYTHVVTIHSEAILSPGGPDSICVVQPRSLSSILFLYQHRL